MRKYKLILTILILIFSQQAFSATKIFLHNSLSKMGMLTRSKPATGCGNGAQNYVYRSANTTQGSSTVTNTFAPTATAPPCLPQTATSGGELLVFITPPISSAITISGNINYSTGCAESQVNLNAGIRFVVYKWSNSTKSISSTVQTSATSTECGTTAALRTITAAAPTSTNFSIGDRIIITVEVMNVGAWAGNSTRTFSLLYDGTAASTGDAFANFVDNISFSADSEPSYPQTH